MLKTHLTAGIAAAALMTTAALAQTTPAPAGGQPAAPATQNQTASMPGGGQFVSQMPKDMMRASKLMGVDVYGSDNQKIGDVDEAIVDRDGKIHSIVVGIGGFLGIGQKDVAIPYDQVQWISAEEARTASGTQPATGAGGVTSPTPPASTTGGQPATTGSTGAAGTSGTAGTAASSDGTPARAMVKMSKADLQNAPEFRYTANTASGTTGGASGTNPPASTTRPATPQ